MTLTKPYPEETANPTREALYNIQTLLMEYLYDQPEYDEDSIEGGGYSMYRHNVTVEAETTQGVPIKITIEVK